MRFWRSGNVLFLILLAVALFAALSYAVTKATGGGVIDISKDQSELDTAKQQSIQANIDGALWRLKLINGCKDNEISYETPSGDNENPDAPEDNSCHVYHPAGGGVPYISLGGSDDSCELTELEIGEECEGVFYAGDYNGRLYTTSGNQGAYQWKTSSTLTANTRSSDGESNTNAMILAGAAQHPAAQACRTLGEEWFIPSRAELDTIWDNGNNSLNIPNGFYLSSQEVNSEDAWMLQISSGTWYSILNKIGSNTLRCVRRD